MADFVIVETSRGRQMGQVVVFAEPEPDKRAYKPILRLATPQDLVGYQVWQAKAQEALILCRQRAAEMSGFENVKFVRAQYNFDGSMLTIIYSSEDRINPNRLRSVLRRSLRKRVEMRQVGPRDVAKLLEGYGACGVVRCCSRFVTEFIPISIKMAKTQNISLNPSEITGVCGRLRCCLSYEYEQYREAKQGLPKKGKWVQTPHGQGKVIDLLPLEESAVVIIEDIRHVVHRDELTVIPKPPLPPPPDFDTSEDDSAGDEPGKRQRRKRDA
ncbi:MAG: stage 0 sporulation family protein [Anaerolineae bacterium]|nr:stage 0 sporulation family protein [Anaerolineae bacterium]